MDNKYAITCALKGSNLPYLSAVFEGLEDGNRNLISVIQNSNVCDKINEEDIKLFISKIQKCDISELPDMTEFFKTNVALLPTDERLTDFNIITKFEI